MFSPRIFLLALLDLSLRPAPALRAQTAVSSLADYTGPRYPGGPDSLRALVGRSLRQTGATPTGHALVQFELKPDGQPESYALLFPPGRASKPLTEAANASLRYLQSHMPAWQPALPDPEARSGDKPNRVSLGLDFTLPLAAQPYEYADQNPVFGTLVQALPAQRLRYLGKVLTDPAMRAQFQASARGLATFCQMQVMYPPEALRAHQQGTVLASFEVAENGYIERPEIISSAGSALDDEVLRVLALVPTATTPAQLSGQPVRVRYILPLTFRIQ